MLNEILNFLYKKKTTNIKIIKNENLYSEYVIIATGTSKKHIKSLATDFLKNFNKKNTFLSGKNSEWLILSIEDITIHIMSNTERALYDLESLYLNNC